MMPKSITLSVTHPDGKSGPIDGFTFFWATYVKRFNSAVHCQDCLVGERIAEFNGAGRQDGQLFLLDKMNTNKYVYVCGFASGKENERSRKNFHLALGYAEGRSVSAVTFNGYTVTAQNAVMLQIPALPKNWQPDGATEPLPDITSRCRNFQFGVEYFGYPSPSDNPTRLPASALATPQVE